MQHDRHLTTGAVGPSSSLASLAHMVETTAFDLAGYVSAPVTAQLVLLAAELERLAKLDEIQRLNDHLPNETMVPS